MSKWWGRATRTCSVKRAAGRLKFTWNRVDRGNALLSGRRVADTLAPASTHVCQDTSAVGRKVPQG